MAQDLLLRNIAIIAHVDHGKTTLVDAMLRYTHAVKGVASEGTLIMDSMDLEREKGITIRAKNASLLFGDIKINIVDTPGHADFGGEVERTLRMVDGALLLVDAKDGPMPQTKFVLRKAIGLGLPVIVVVNKIDCVDAQVDDVLNRTFDLFVELNASHDQLDFPIVYASALLGTATLHLDKPSHDVGPLFETIVQKIPPPTVLPDDPLQILVLALAYDSFKGIMGIGKIQAGSIKKGQAVTRIDADGKQTRANVMALLAYQGLERVEISEAGSGEIVAVAGFEEISIGDTITDPERPRPLPRVEIEEPTLRMSFAVNKSPFAGKEGKYVTSRSLRERLEKELETNVALRMADTDNPDTMLVSGRGELHLAILIETMRREGYEMEVSQPEVVYKEKDGKRLEPFEFLTIDAPSEHQGTVMEELGRRRGEMKEMSPAAATGDLHMEYHITTRGLLGLKSILLKKTRGTAVAHHMFEGYQPVITDLPGQQPHGSLVATEDGVSSSYAIMNIQERGELFIGPAVPVYSGMVVGQASRDQDLGVNICKLKKLTNVRSNAEATILLVPPREMTLELSLEYIGPDELLEVTPKSLRIRKRIADQKQRLRSQKDS